MRLSPTSLYFFQGFVFVLSAFTQRLNISRTVLRGSASKDLMSRLEQDVVTSTPPLPPASYQTHIATSMKTTDVGVSHFSCRSSVTLRRVGAFGWV